MASALAASTFEGLLSSANKAELCHDQPVQTCTYFSYLLGCSRPLFSVERCLYIHIYHTVSMRFTSELFDCGLIADAESRLLALLRVSFQAGNAYRRASLREN